MSDLTVYLVRHGRTALNTAGVLRGQFDVSLDEHGEREVQRVGGRFRRTAIKHVACSPLMRARDAL
jgi:broad specificity phosphatase PhoE